jgi:hypothetical protein
MMASIIGIPFAPKEHSTLIIAIFQFIPGIAFLLLPFTCGKKNPVQNNFWVRGVYSSLYAPLALLHLATVFYLFSSDLSSFLSIPPSSASSTALLLYYDGLWLSASLALLVLFKSGPSALLLFCFGSVVAGPGAAFLGYAQKWEIDGSSHPTLKPKPKTA